MPNKRQSEPANDEQEEILETPAPEAEKKPKKLLVLHLPKDLKKAARECAHAEDKKLKAWIVDLIKQHIAIKEPPKPKKPAARANKAMKALVNSKRRDF